MHIPDGFLDAPTALATGGVSAAAITYALRRVGRRLGDRTVPLLGLLAAFIFAAQMLNFPVAAGTSGHVLGAALACALVGPWAACVIMTAVLLVQAFGMADGGISALGANALNMAVIGVLVAYASLWLLGRVLPKNSTSYLLSVAVASWASVVVASAAASAELAASGTVDLGIALPAMLSVHMVIGLGEALITTIIVASVLAARPDLVRTFDWARLVTTRGRDGATEPVGLGSVPKPRLRFWSFIATGLVIAAALAVFLSPFASPSPDGLERVATDTGFSSASTDQGWRLSPLPDYRLPGIDSEGVSTAVAGLIGTTFMFALVFALGRWLGNRWGKGKAGSRRTPTSARQAE